LQKNNGKTVLKTLILNICYKNIIIFHRMKYLFLIITLLPLALTGQGQEIDIQPIPLPYNIGLVINHTQSKMMMEDETIFVPTSNGIYSLEMADYEKGWTSCGFEGENLIECVHNGDEWLAITRNQNMRLLLRSTDNGKTVEDFTPYGLFPNNKYRTVLRLCQDPVNPQTIYLISGYVGVLKSLDFGKTWSLLTDCANSNNTYCGFEIHPLNPDILLQHAESAALAPAIMISNNGGLDWINSWGYPTSDIVLPNEPDYAEDCIHDVAFHPTDIDTWVLGGEGLIAKTTDGGRTWTHKGESWGYHYSTLYDSLNPNVIYSLGTNDKDNNRTGWIFMVSSDGGETWKNANHHVLDNPWYYDMKQTDDDLIILGTENLYFVKKKDLQSTSGLQEVITEENVSQDSNIYSIDGVIVKRKATEFDLEQLPKGVYIYNGSKVLIK